MKLPRVHLPLLCACALLGASGARALALDLTPVAAYRMGNEGPAVPVLMVKDGAKEYSFIPPGKWLVDGNATSIRLTASDNSGSWMKIMVITKRDDLKLPDEQTAPEDLQKWAAQFIPGANDVKYVKTVPSPYMVKGEPSTEFIFNYAAYGQRAPISISLVDFNETQALLVLISADNNNFERVRQAGVACMFSWQLFKGDQKGVSTKPVETPQAQ